MSAPWKSDEELFQVARRELFTAVVGDVADRLGLRHQFLPPRIGPLRDDFIVIGRAMTVLQADVFDDTHPDSPTPPMRQPFGLLFHALDDLKPHEVYIAAGASPTYALWGELLSTRAMKLGAAGAVLDGYSRDTRGILALDFPTFSHGRYAQDQGPRGKVIDFRIPIEIGGVRIAAGDVVFGDLDGVIIIPRQAEQEIFRLALEKARGEQRVAHALRSGMSAVDAWAQFGIM